VVSTARDILHIGYHKTATTWFQRRFYPHVRNARYLSKAWVEQALLDAGALLFDPSAVRERLVAERADGKRLILCHEGLVGNPHSGGLHGCYTKEMARRLSATLPEASVVIVLRSQVDMIAATYKQYVRAGGTHRPQRYLFPQRYLGGAYRKPRKIPLFTLDHFDYQALVTHYEGLFGCDNVHVLLYETFREDGPGFVRAMAERFGLDVDVDTLSFRQENVSLRRNLLPLARALNRLTVKNVADKRCVADLLPSHMTVRRLLDPLNATALAGPVLGPRELLGADVVAEIEDRFRAGNAALAKARGLPLGRYSYPL